MRKLLVSAAHSPDPSPGGVIATAMRYLANAAPTAAGVTVIFPGGTTRYITRAEAEAWASHPPSEVRQ